MQLIATLASEAEEDRATRLSAQDWVIAALEVLLKDGIEAVQITTLADKLGVTRGSFYWHFKNRQQLLDAILAEWRARNTDIMVQVLATASSVEEGILNLFSVWVDHSKFNSTLDQAVRDWGRRSSPIGEMVSAEDDNRVAAIAGFLERQGYPETEAFIRARVIYFTQLSYYALEIEEPMAQRMDYLAAYYQCFTGQEISTAAAETFRARLLAKERSK